MTKFFVDNFSPTIAAICAMVVILREDDDVDKAINKIKVSHYHNKRGLL